MKRRSHFASKQRKSLNGSFVIKPKKTKLANDDIKPELSSKIELLKNLKPVYVTITKLSSDQLEKYQVNSEGQLNGSIVDTGDLNTTSKLSNQKLKSVQKLNSMESTQIETIDLSSEDEQVTIQVVPSSEVIKDISSFKNESINGKDDVNVISLPNNVLDQENVTDKLCKIGKNATILKEVLEIKYDKEDERMKDAETTEVADENEGDKNEDETDDDATEEQVVDISTLEQQVTIDKKGSSLNPKTFFCIFCRRKTIIGFEKARIHYQHHLDCYLYKCSLCLEVLTDLGSLCKHYRQNHCSKKKATFMKQTNDYTLDWINTFLESQIQVATRKLGYKKHCPVCQAFERQEDIVEVPINSINLKLLYSHIFKHLHYEPFVCTFCEKSEKRFTAHLINTNAYEHVLRDHPEHADTSLEDIFRQANIRSLDLFVKTFLSSFGINFSFKSPKTIPNFFKNRFFEKTQSQKQKPEASNANLFKFKEVESTTSLPSLPLNQVSPNVTLTQHTTQSTPLPQSQTDLSKLNNLLFNYSILGEQGLSPHFKVTDQNKNIITLRSPLTSHQAKKFITYSKSQTALNINAHASTQTHLYHLPFNSKSTQSREPPAAHFQLDKAAPQVTEAGPLDIINSSLASSSNLRQSFGLPATSQALTMPSYLPQPLVNNSNQMASSSLYLPDFMIIQPDLPDLQILNEVTRRKAESYFCIFCNNQVVFNTRIDASFHFARHLNYKPLVCLLCSQKFDDFDTLMSHFVTHHDHESVCSNKTCDNLLYYARQDAKIEQWIEEYLYFQKSGKVHELLSSQYQSFCLICAKLSKQSPCQQSQHNDLDFIYEHVNTHFNYRPFSCMLCRDKSETTSLPWLGRLAQSHLVSHGYSIMSKPLLSMFFFYEPITKLEIMIKDYLLTRYFDVNTLISAGNGTTNESSFFFSTSTSDHSVQNANAFFTQTKAKAKNMPTSNFSPTEGQDMLVCYHCNQLLPTKKHLRDHHSAFHPDLSLGAYPIRFSKVV